MGANGSKPETKVFTPDTPIDFSATFLSQLESSPEVCPQKKYLTLKIVETRQINNKQLY